MDNFSTHFLPGRVGAIRYLTWGQPQAAGVIIWHGLTGAALDHEALAERLAAAGYFVICPDAPGCGLSDWPKTAFETSLSHYRAVALALIDHLGLTRLAWIGSSKGGGVGIMMGADPRVSHLLLNDGGTQLPEEFRRALARRMTAPPVFTDIPAFEVYLRKTLTKGGLALDDAAWTRLAVQWSRRRDDGAITVHYAPMLGQQFIAHSEDFDLWDAWDRITAKTLLLRGSPSVVSDVEAAQMQERGPRCRVVSRPGGHMTLLDSPDEQDLILRFLCE